jgi:hypothetical protein
MHLAVTIPRRNFNRHLIKSTPLFFDLNPEELALSIVTRRYLERGELEVALLLLKKGEKTSPGSSWIGQEIKKFEDLAKNLTA